MRRRLFSLSSLTLIVGIILSPYPSVGVSAGRTSNRNLLPPEMRVAAPSYRAVSGHGSSPLEAGHSGYPLYQPASQVGQYDPENVEFVAQVDGAAGPVAVRGDRVYTVVDGAFTMLDISDPASPRLVGQLDIPSTPKRVVLAGGHAYLAGSTKIRQGVPGDYVGWFRVLAISDATDPIQIAYHEVPGNLHGMAVAGTYAYLVGDTRSPEYDGGWLQVLDISDPSKPREAGYYKAAYEAYDIALAPGHRYAYVSYGLRPGLGLRVIDVSDPTNPIEVDTAIRGGGRLAVAGDYAYTAGFANLSVFDISDPTSPTLMSTYSQPLTPREVAVTPSGNYAYVVSDRGGLQVVDLSDPNDPVKTGHYFTPARPYRVAVEAGGEYIYVVDAEYGLFILRYTGPWVAPASPPVEPTSQDATSGAMPSTTTEGRIAYIGPDRNVWLMDPDGQNKERLTTDADPDSRWYHNPQWSPNGDQLAFCRTARTGEAMSRSWEETLIVTDVASRQLRQIADSCLAGWSPDGKHLAAAERSYQGPVEACDRPDYYRVVWRVYTTSPDTGSQAEVVSATVDRSGGRGASEYCWDGYLVSEWGSDFYGRNRLSWSADGRQMIVETPECILHIDLDSGQVDNLDVHAAPSCGYPSASPSQFAFSPQGDRIASIEPDTHAVVVSTDALADPLHRFGWQFSSDRLVFDRPVILGWSSDGENLYHRWGQEGVVLRTDSDLTHPLKVFQEAYGVAFGRLTSSPDSARIAFSVVTGDPESTWTWAGGEGCPYPDIYIWVADADGSNATLLAEGRHPAWQPHLATVSPGEFLERKQATIPRLEQATVEIMAVPFPITAFDDSRAIDLIDRLQVLEAQGQLQPAHAESFARVTLQEEIIAEMLPLYASTSGDLAAIATDIIGVVLTFQRAADTALEACAQPGSRVSGACGSLRRMIFGRLFWLLDSFVQFTAVSVGGPTADDFLISWNGILNGLRVQVDAGKAVREMLLDTAVKGAAARVLVDRYVDRIQPSLDQGVRSADPSYSGAEPTWSTDGALARAEVHAQSFPRQASNISQYAHSVHQDAIRATHLAAVFADVADLGSVLTPWGKIAWAVKTGTQIMHILTDVYPAYLTVDSLNCTRHLSERAGPLVFDPDQPAPGCTVVTFGGRPSPGVARHLVGDLQLALPEAMRERVEGEIAEYRAALSDVLSALPDGDPQEIDDAVVSLEGLDERLFTSTAQALRITSAVEGTSHQTLDTYEHANKASADALHLYLLIAEYLLAPEEERSSHGIEQAASVLLTDLDVLQAALEHGRALEEAKAVPVIESIVPSPDTGAPDSADVTVAIRNVGTAAAQQVVVKIVGQEGQESESRLTNLRPGEVETTTLAARISGTGGGSVAVEVSAEGTITDATIRPLFVEDAPQKAVTPDGGDGPAFPCPCSAVALSLVMAAVWIRTRRT